MRRLAAVLTFACALLAVRGGDTRTITDMAGRRVEIPAKVERVVTLGGTPAVNAFLFALGEADLIQNGMPRFMAAKTWKYQTVFGPQLVGRPIVSDAGPEWAPRLEVLATLPHDVVFVVDATSAELLARRGFTVVSLDWHSPDSIKDTIILVADIVGVPERARAYVATYDALLAQVRTAIATETWHPRTLYLKVAGFMLPMVTTATWMIESAGGVNVARDLPDHARISAEQVLAWNPEVIFVWSRDEVALLEGDPRLAEVDAVRHHRIHVVPMGAHMWTHYTPEQPLAVLWAASRFYPQRFRATDLHETVRRFYADFFRTHLDDEQLAEILVEDGPH